MHEQKDWVASMKRPGALRRGTAPKLPRVIRLGPTYEEKKLWELGEFSNKLPQFFSSRVETYLDDARQLRRGAPRHRAPEIPGGAAFRCPTSSRRVHIAADERLSRNVPRSIVFSLSRA